ncbi:HlyC/CorC family transporter [Kangiella spongicola]|jgi:magnesium and cobalt transporter|uniref:Magnesium and cobalt efflux protein CorC n=1 Tax=Kangiella spongicola TaxID=796379 RepID=A0A318DC81_9GAMM|nr:transporter associated domain-containing protein [Kangiella spongicola]PXF64547.1 magnesium/cobalt efflux protein [Kangiella spongicola]
MSDDKPPSRSFLQRIFDIFQSEPQDRQQLVEVLRVAKDDKLIKTDSLAMMEGVLQVAEMQVRDIMIPRSQMNVIHEDASLQEILPIVSETQHSRYPVVGENRDDIEGIMLAKELLSYAYDENGSQKFDIKDILRPAYIIPESKRLDVLLTEFRSKRNHMAIVVDEYGCVSGLVTIEDVLEQIVGDIEDEFDIDDEESNIKLHSNGEYIIKAQTDIEDFNERLGSDFPDQEFDTIGGLLVNKFGHMPQREETIKMGDFKFTVLNADQRRVHLLRVKPLAQEQSS